jgi:two-component system, chemotaxis family, chemotaxis protein CheY
MAGNVLIVDDSAIMRRMIKRVLTISGLDVGDVFEASNGIEALAQMAEREINAVLLDINMPIMSGMKLVERMRDDERLREMPVVIVSTEGSDTRIEQLMQSGALAFVRKPFRPEQIRDVLAPVIGLKAETAPATNDECSF